MMTSTGNDIEEKTKMRTDPVTMFFSLWVNFVFFGMIILATIAVLGREGIPFVLFTKLLKYTGILSLAATIYFSFLC